MQTAHHALYIKDWEIPSIREQSITNKHIEMQEEMSQKVEEASSGGGMVTAKVNGKGDLVDLKIEPKIVETDPIIIPSIEKAKCSVSKKTKDFRGQAMGAIV